MSTRMLFALATLVGLAVSSLAFGAPSGTFTENFDGVTPPALPSGWIASVNTGILSDIPWQTKAVGFANSPPNAVWVNDINDYADITLTSPSFAITTASPTVSFQQAYTLWAPDAGPLANGAFNGAVLEISISSGPFVDFVAAGGTFTAGGYNTILDPNFDNPIGALGAGGFNATLDANSVNPTPPLSRPVWSGASGGFVATTGTLPAGAIVGATVQFRWRLGTEGGGRGFDTYSGWWVDDFQCSCAEVVVNEIFENGFDP